LSTRGQGGTDGTACRTAHTSVSASELVRSAVTGSSTQGESTITGQGIGGRGTGSSSGSTGYTGIG